MYWFQFTFCCDWVEFWSSAEGLDEDSSEGDSVNTECRGEIGFVAIRAVGWLYESEEKGGAFCVERREEE